jgi:hypothetical protein
MGLCVDSLPIVALILSLTPQTDILRALSPHFPMIIYATGLSGYGGLTVPLSLFLDIFSALTLHISLSYLVLKKALFYQIFAMRSLFNLFRGKAGNRFISVANLPGFQVNVSTSCIGVPTRGTMKWTNSSLERYCSRCLRSASQHY